MIGPKVDEREIVKDGYILRWWYDITGEHLWWDYIGPDGHFIALGRDYIG